MKLEFGNLIWNKDSESWICTCGARYHRPDKPRPSYCMRCGCEWLNREDDTNR